MQHVTVIGSECDLKSLVEELRQKGDMLLPLNGGGEYGHSYWRLNRLIDSGKLKAFNLYGSRYVRASDLEALSAPQRGRPRKETKLTSDALGFTL